MFSFVLLFGCLSFKMLPILQVNFVINYAIATVHIKCNVAENQTPELFWNCMDSEKLRWPLLGDQTVNSSLFPVEQPVVDFFFSQGGVVRLKWDAETPLIYTGCLDGVVRLWDCRSGNCEREWYGHNGEILDLAVARYNLWCTHYYVNKALYITQRECSALSSK